VAQGEGPEFKLQNRKKKKKKSPLRGEWLNKEKWKKNKLN
jgi:hypothetical protein